MNKKNRMRSLLFRIEKCFKCYKKFVNFQIAERVRIRNWCHEGPWFYPPDEELQIEGFFGTGKVMFIAERPSTRAGRIPSLIDQKFYEILKKNGLGDSHLTDLIKCRGTVKESKNNKDWTTRVENCFPFLLDEIKILKPEIIVAVGRTVENELKRRGITEKFRVQWIPHYSYAFTRGIKKEADKKIAQEIRRISLLVKNKA